MPTDAPAAEPSDPITARLDDKIEWYDRKSITNQRTYKRIKVVEIAAAALIPFVGAARVPYVGVVTAALGVTISMLEGLLHLNQYQQNWITYRSTCEALKHEKYTYIASAPPYSGLADARALLAERIESLISQEHAKWASTRPPEQAANKA